MLVMDMVTDIRFRFCVKGEKISKITNDLKLDWKTVQKYVDMTDFNEPPPKAASERRFCPKLDPFKSTIDEWLIADKQAPRNPLWLVCMIPILEVYYCIEIGYNIYIIVY